MKYVTERLSLFATACGVFLLAAMAAYDLVQALMG